MDIQFYQEQAFISPCCWPLVTMVYMRELGLTVRAYGEHHDSIRLLSPERRIKAIAEAFRIELHRGEHGFRQIAQPVDFAVVLMGRAPKLGLHHCGVFWHGSVLHALDSGTLFQDMNTLRAQYPLMQFWSRT